jgi:hypothetical protein
MFGFFKKNTAGDEAFLLRKAVQGLLERESETREELRQVRAACFGSSPSDTYAWITSRGERGEFTAIEAVRLLLQHFDLNIREERATPARKVLEPIPHPELPLDMPPVQMKRGRTK